LEKVVAEGKRMEAEIDVCSQKEPSILRMTKKNDILNFMRNIVCLHFLSRCAQKHIQHQYQTEMIKKTETVTFSLYLPNFNEFFIEELEKQFTTVFSSREKFHNIL
jgi:hypothetical protein